MGVIAISNAFSSSLNCRKELKPPSQTVKNPRKFQSEIWNLKDSDLQVTFIANKTQSNENSKELPKSSSLTPITKNDPLGALSTVTHQHYIETSRKDLDSLNIKRRLFDYKPFEEETKVELRNVNVKESDFLFEKLKQKTVNPSNGTSSGKSEGEEEDSDYEYEYEDEYEDEEDEDDDDDDENYEDEDSNLEEDEEVLSSAGSSLKPRNGSFNSDKSNNALENCVPFNAPAKSSNQPNESFSNYSNSNSQKNDTINPSTPKSTFVANKLSFLMRKVENTFEVSKSYLTDIKDAFVREAVSPLNQQEISSKLKSISNYQINPAHYLNNLNNLVKSNSNSANFNYGGSQSSSNQGQNEALVPHSSENSNNTKHSKLWNKNSHAVDLDELPADDSFKSLSLKWWGLDEDGDLLSSKKLNYDLNRIMLEISISSCNV